MKAFITKYALTIAIQEASAYSVVNFIHSLVYLLPARLVMCGFYLGDFCTRCVGDFGR